MYVNLVLGAVALVVLWLYLKKLLVKDDALSESPAKLLERELARRREREKETEKAFERLRDVAIARMRPVAQGLEELRAALPEETQAALSWEDDEDSITIAMHAARAGKEEKAVALVVAWRAPDLDLRLSSASADNIFGHYALKRSDVEGEEKTDGLDACMRRITSFIVDFME